MRRAAMVGLFCLGLLFGWVSPSSAEVVADTSTVVTVPCGTQDQPCVQQMQEWQYLSLMLFAGTGLLVSLVTFFRREGASLDA